jgi:hypothetical protein
MMKAEKRSENVSRTMLNKYILPFSKKRFYYKIWIMVSMGYKHVIKIVFLPKLMENNKLLLFCASRLNKINQNGAVLSTFLSTFFSKL